MVHNLWQSLVTVGPNDTDKQENAQVKKELPWRRHFAVYSRDDFLSNIIWHRSFRAVAIPRIKIRTRTGYTFPG